MPNQSSTASEGEKLGFPAWELGDEPIQPEIEMLPFGGAYYEGGSKVNWRQRILLEICYVHNLPFFPHTTLANKEFTFHQVDVLARAILIVYKDLL